MFRSTLSLTRNLAFGARGYAIRSQSAKLTLPQTANEKVYDYGPGSPEREKLKKQLAVTRDTVREIPVVIGGKEYYTDNVTEQVIPSDHSKVIARIHQADESLIRHAIKVAMQTRKEWMATPWEHRAGIFLKAADLVSTSRRPEILAATMLGQGKTVYQAEIDAAAETIDFLRFNVKYANEIYGQQPEHHSTHVWNRIEYRPLEGFVAAISPFNFTAIGANLATAPAIMGNTVLWKPAKTSMLSNYVFYQSLLEAGLPEGVINFVPAGGLEFGKIITTSPDLAAINFTGSTATFNWLWKKVAENLDVFRVYPRLIGECGGKNFHIIHPSATDIDNVINATIRSAFEYQGQKCSAVSRMYVPESLWPRIKDGLVKGANQMKVGQPDEFSSFFSAVIDQISFDEIAGFIDRAKGRNMELLAGGNYDASTGYFVQPTIFVTKDPHDELMEHEIFGPVLTIYVYPDDQWKETLQIVNDTSPYALTGSIFASKRTAIMEAHEALYDAAGNMYINAKSTGAVVGQQPFGGSRASGTNDKAGAESYLHRFTSPQAIKENFAALDSWTYPHTLPDK